jgi:hypothetical protein
VTKPKYNLTLREAERFVRQLEQVRRHLGEKIIAPGTDWRFLNELKKELKS